MKPLLLLAIFLVPGSLVQAQPPATSSAQNVVVVRIINPPKITMTLKLEEPSTVGQQNKWQVTRTEIATLTTVIKDITITDSPSSASHNTMRMNGNGPVKIFIYTHSES